MNIYICTKDNQSTYGCTTFSSTQTQWKQHEDNGGDAGKYQRIGKVSV